MTLKEFRLIAKKNGYKVKTRTISFVDLARNKGKFFTLEKNVLTPNVEFKQKAMTMDIKDSNGKTIIYTSYL